MFGWIFSDDGEMDPYIGIPKHLVEKQESAYEYTKLYKKGRYDEIERVEKQKETGRVCFDSGFPYLSDEDRNKEEEHELKAKVTVFNFLWWTWLKIKWKKK